MKKLIEFLNSNKDIKKHLIKKCLNHIEKVEDDENVKTDGDNFDYWNAIPIDNGRFIDFNVFESNQERPFTWTAEAYGVTPPTKDNEYHSINTNDSALLFSYTKEKGINKKDSDINWN